MKAQAIHVPKELVHSFVCRIDTEPDVNNYLHFHNELELIYFKKGSGMQYIADSITPFIAGNVVLIGSGIPHYWRLSPEYFDVTPGDVEIYVIHFNKELFENAFFCLPEFQGIRNTLALGKLSLQLSAKDKPAIGMLIKRVVRSVGAKRFSNLIECLSEIGYCRVVQKIHSSDSYLTATLKDKDRLEAVYNHTLRNYRRKIELKEIAATANVSPTSFCRIFKAAFKKTYSRFLNEVRVGQACRMLRENHLSIKEVCYQSGYSCFTSFHRHFRDITGKTPLVYRKEFG